MTRDETMARLMLSLVILVLGCQDNSHTHEETSVRDSAGITIFEVSGTPSEMGLWELAAEPELTIGTVDGDVEYQLWDVAAAITLSDGSIAVVNRGSLEVRLYENSGVFRGAIGGGGEGPGEFSYMELAGVLTEDTIVVSDLNLRRLTYLHPEVGFVRSAPISDELDRWNWTLGMLGGLVMRGGLERYELSTHPDGQKGIERIPTSFQTATLDGALVNDFGVFPMRDIFHDMGYVSGHLTSVARDVPYGMKASFTVGGENFYYGSGDRYEIEVFSSEGQLQRLIRWDRDLVPVTSEHLDLFLEEKVAAARSDEELQEIRRTFREVPAASHFPAYLDFKTDWMGCLWVREYPKGIYDEDIYHIFDSESRLLGRISVPKGLEIMEIGRDHVMALVHDELDVEYLHRYRLTRP